MSTLTMIAPAIAPSVPHRRIPSARRTSQTRAKVLSQPWAPRSTNFSLRVHCSPELRSLPSHARSRPHRVSTDGGSIGSPTVFPSQGTSTNEVRPCSTWGSHRSPRHAMVPHRVARRSDPASATTTRATWESGVTLKPKRMGFTIVRALTPVLERVFGQSNPAMRESVQLPLHLGSRRLAE